MHDLSKKKSAEGHLNFAVHTSLTEKGPEKNLPYLKGAGKKARQLIEGNLNDHAIDWNNHFA